MLDTAPEEPALTPALTESREQYVLGVLAKRSERHVTHSTLSRTDRGKTDWTVSFHIPQESTNHHHMKVQFNESFSTKAGEGKGLL